MKKVIALMSIAIGLALPGAVSAHGSAAKHGGIVKSAGDLSFELVSKDGAVVIYVDDHGKALPTTGASGTLTVLKGTVKTALPLVAGAGNTLVAQGAQLAPGNKVVAAVTLPKRDALSIRFSIR